MLLAPRQLGAPIRRSAAGWLLSLTAAAAMPLAGCQSRVVYDEEDAAAAADVGAPLVDSPFDEVAADAEALATEESVPETQEVSSLEEAEADAADALAPETQSPAEGDAEEAPSDGETAAAPLPWETDEPAAADASPQAEALFGEVEATPPTPPADATTEETPAAVAAAPDDAAVSEEAARAEVVTAETAKPKSKSDDPFGDFLSEAYGDTEVAPSDAPSEAPPAADEPAVAAPSEPPAAAPPAPAAKAPTLGPGANWKIDTTLKAPEPSREEEEEAPADVTVKISPAEVDPPMFLKEEPAASVTPDVGDRYAPPKDVEAPAPSVEPLEPKAPTVEAAPEAAPPREPLPWETDASTATTVEAATPETLAPPVPADEPPAAEPERASLPVRAGNTRHLAWLYGAKLGMARLADAGGAGPDEESAWTAEAQRLAEELGAPSAEGDPSGDVATRVVRLMDEAQSVGDTIASRHGTDHAALVEIALKTNALVALYETRPQLAAPVARAVRSAAERAELPDTLWRDAVATIERQPDADELFDAVTGLHRDVEAHLR